MFDSKTPAADGFYLPEVDDEVLAAKQQSSSGSGLNSFVDQGNAMDEKD
jgi:hypothetical protein